MLGCLVACFDYLKLLVTDGCLLLFCRFVAAVFCGFGYCLPFCLWVLIETFVLGLMFYYACCVLVF